MNAATPVVEARGLSKRYGAFLALDGLDLAIAPGTVFGFIGPNGAGKTTTMRILATLLAPSAGEAWVAGHSVTRAPRAVRGLLGYMPDQFGVYDNMKVWEYLDFFASTYGIPRARRLALIADLLALVDLSEKRDGAVEALSRGMQQRLGLARALVHDPPLLLLDEPAAGLDPRARVELRATLRQLGALGKAVLVSSHILSELADICDAVGIVERGRLLAAGPVADVLRQAQTHRVLTIRLLADGRLGDDDVLERVRTIPGVLAASVEPLPTGGRATTTPAPLPENGVAGAAPTLPAEVSTEQLLAVVPPPARLLRVEFDGDDYRLYQLLAELLTRGLPVFGFTEEVGDLEDAFLRITKGLVA